jgi:CubicO group peptidase (beta-lactamase class C family)
MKLFVLICICQLGRTVICAQPGKNSLDSLFSAFNNPQTPGASVLVIKDGKKIYEKSFGFANLENRIPATQFTNYRLASVTKQFTAMCIMMLVEKHMVSLEDPLIKFFPVLPSYAGQITIRHLLNHSSGIADYGALIPPETIRPLSDTDVLNLVKKQDTPYFKPGERFEYSNTAYVLLGLIIGKVSGIPFKDFLRRNIFSPLKMDHTTVNDPDSEIHSRAYGYSEEEKKFTRTDQSLTSYTLGDGGIYSSVEDLFKWDQELYSTRLIKKSTLQQMFTVSTPFDKKNPVVGYGFGWFIEEKNGGKLIYHGGSSIGFTSFIERIPDQRLTIIILTNRQNADLRPIRIELENLYAKE